MAKVKCDKCGSNKVTRSTRGKPYMNYVYWARAKSKELGWEIVSFSGCTKSGSDECIDCAKK